jgi:hypothetical protein
MLHRLTQTEVGTERQKRNQFGKAQVPAIPRCHTRTLDLNLRRASELLRAAGAHRLVEQTPARRR